MKELKRYYRQIRSWLPCCGKEKKAIINGIDASVKAYLEDHPQAVFADVEHHFGQPAQIAASCVDEMNTPQLLRKLRIRKRVSISVTVGVLTAILLWASAVTISFIEANNTTHGYYEVYITEE